MSRPFSAMKEGLGLYGLFIFIGTALLAGKVLSLGLFFVAFGLFTMFFFRDPNRGIEAAPREIVCPADGTIVQIDDLTETEYYDGPCKRVSVFLSILNVHVNRAPAAGKIMKKEYRSGKFMNAMKAETSEHNESNAVWMETEHGLMVVRQIAGAIARRIVCVVEEGDEVARGEKFGMIKFSSRTELYLPVNAEICVKERDKVQAGSTIIARFPE